MDDALDLGLGEYYCQCLTNPAAGSPLIALAQTLVQSLAALRALPEHQQGPGGGGGGGGGGQEGAQRARMARCRLVRRMEELDGVLQ